jgi:general secretion pathway protein L
MLRALQHRFLRFLRWWVRELAACLPPGVLTAFRGGRRRLVLVISDDRVVFERHHGRRAQTIGQLDLTAASPEELRKDAVRLVRRRGLRSLPVEISLPPKHVLWREVDLPISAAENLREVLGFEMDRYTPFKAAEVYYDYSVERVDSQFKRLKVDLALVPRRIADNAIAIAKRWNFEPVKIGMPPGADDDGASFNLLPRPENQAGGGLLPRLSVILLLFFLALGAAAVFVPLNKKQEAVAAIEAELLRARAAAGQVANMESRLNELIRQSQFVVEEKRSRPTGTKLLNEVTKLLPGDTWLLQFNWKNDNLSLSGFSKKASALIGSLERSPILTNVRFNSSVTTDPRLEMDRFNLSASIVGLDH